MKIVRILFSIAVLISLVPTLNAQDIKRERPKEWEGVVYGGRFMDRFLPIPKIGELTSNTWGADAVKPRYVANGIEHKNWSYWGGNIKKDTEGKYHMYVCRWREDSEKGHMAWPQSEVAHVVSNNLIGPYIYKETIGKGHNPEIYQIKDGSYVLYVNKGYYTSKSLNGPWSEKKYFEFDQRDRPITDHMTNLTFAQREDGSYLMICRGGGVWISETGLPPFYQVSEKSVYPPYDGKYEDPVVWKTDIQYHMVVNDWLGRIAYYLRSKDGINWKTDVGEAYLPGIVKYEDKTKEDWYKFERIKVFQDKYGRAIQANFAVADTIKWQDKGSDKYSSKNVSIPLEKGKLITVLNTDKITTSTKFIKVKIKAEEDFNPQKDMKISSLRFGASEEVNFGRGSKVIKTKKEGKDLVLTFDGKGNGITENNFVGKLLGKTKKGKLLFGYAKLPKIKYIQQAVSSRLPILSLNGKELKIKFEVQNFGQIVSKSTPFIIEYKKDGEWQKLISNKIPVLKPYEKNQLTYFARKFANVKETVELKITINQENQQPVILKGGVVIR